MGDAAIGARAETQPSEQRPQRRIGPREKTEKAVTGGSQQVHHRAEDLSDRENNEVTQGLTERSLGWGAEDAAQVLG